ncbi:hypothetical protein HAX54_017436 [Datura stramonium]|uniref:Uncharacterized protein n=1 Tax=Datura stramonium TaxID=4076 RepID=A0ABS8UKQ6_DATST|nr:hypothetical protein [Datura stramonium]
MHSGPDVDCGGKPSVHASSKATAADFRVIEAGNSIQVNDLQEIGEHQLERSTEDHRQDGHLSNSSVAEEEILENELVLAETKRNSTEIAGEQMIGVDQTTATDMNTDPSLQQHLHGKRRAETRDLTCGESNPVSTQPFHVVTSYPSKRKFRRVLWRREEEETLRMSLFQFICADYFGDELPLPLPAVKMMKQDKNEKEKEKKMITAAAAKIIKDDSSSRTEHSLLLQPLMAYFNLR